MKSELITTYLRECGGNASAADAGFLAYLANLETVSRVSPLVAGAIIQELSDQRRNLKLIASENYSSLSTQCAMANLLTDKYAEGVAGKRFYAGCDNVDKIEDYASARAQELSGPTMLTCSRTAGLTPTSWRFGRSCRHGSRHPIWRGWAPRERSTCRRKTGASYDSNSGISDCWA